MTVTIYRASDASAPVLSGTAGSLISVLDGCLVNGYGSKTAAGWAKAFTGTNRASYRQGTGSLLGYLDVDDSGPGAGTGKEARMRGYDTMTAIGTGVNPCPTAAQAASGLIIRKSASADTVPRPWVIVADQRTVYMFVPTGDVAGVYYCWMFGEYYSFRTGDLGRNIIIGRTIENSASTSYVHDGFDQGSWVGAIAYGHYINRDLLGSPNAISAGKMGDWNCTYGGITTLIGVLQFTNPADQRIYLAPLRVNCVSPVYTIRGRLRGLWFFCHPVAAATDGDTFNGVGDLAGKSFMILRGTGNGAVVCVETSNTWDTNA